MMRLSRISLVHWHLFVRADLDVIGDAAILGRNRSGKTTLIDLIQTVMTGASGALYRFNRSAGDGGGRSGRTLRAYCLGELNEHDARRSEAITHIALSFEDPMGARPPVVVGVCLEAPAGEDPIVAGRYVAEGVRIDTSYFVEETDGQVRSAPWSVVRDRLERSCADAGTRCLRTETARNHIREYMRLLFTGRRSPDPERFARAFVLALSFENIHSVESFVRSYLLERKDIDIGELRESIQRYRQIQKDIHELERRLEALKLLHTQIGIFETLLRRETVARGSERLALLLETGGALFTNVAELRGKAEALRSAESRIEGCDAKIQQAADLVQSLETQMAASDAERQKLVLTGEARNVERARADLLRRLTARFTAVARAVELLRWRERLQSLRLGEVLGALHAIQDQSAGLQPPDWPRDPKGMEGLLRQAAAAAGGRLPLVTERRDEAIALRRESAKSMESLQFRIGQARQGQVTLERQTLELMATLRREGMKPRALCEVLEVLDETWRDAAEALLGRDTFRGCRVANTRRLAREDKVAPPDSLASVLHSGDALAAAFVVFRLGNVRLAVSQDELLGGGRAIMRDGAYNDGIVIEVRRTRDRKVGRAAAGLMLGELERELENKRAVQKRHDENVGVLEDVQRRLEQLGAPVPEEDRLDALVLRISNEGEQLADIQQRLARVTGLSSPALQSALDEGRRQVASATAEKSELRETRARLGAEINEAKRRLQAGEGQLGSWLSLAQCRRRFRARVGSLAMLMPVRALYVQMRASRSAAEVAREMQREADELVTQYRACEGDVRERLTAYRLQFGATTPSGAGAGILEDIKSWVESNVEALAGNELIRYRQQADEAAEQIGRIFRTGFIHELNSRFSALESDLDELTKALRTRPLHGEIYSLKYYVKPEFKALHRLARESEADEVTLGPLFGRGAPRGQQHAAALTQVGRLLEDEAFKFEEYQDYRNYYGFDLRMRDIESKRETSFERRRESGSGAEKQVPFYVIIGAALASLYHGSRLAMPEALGVGLAVFDEAFSKMDGPNQRTLLEFYGDIGLQVLIAAPTEKRAVVYENLDSIIDVHRFKDEASAETIHIKPPARAAMREANPEYLSDEAVRDRLGGDATEAVAE